MSACKYEDGALWWRGSGERWTYHLPGTLTALRASLALEPEDYARRMVADLDAALAAYEQDRPLEKVA